MNIQVRTYLKTESTLEQVFSLFNKDMFYYLTKKAPVKPVRYDGDEIGDEIHLDMLFPWKDKWISVITEREIGDQESYFVDEGKKLPFGIKSWKHKHIVRKAEGGIEIVDDITFSAGNKVLDIFWYISFLPQFLARRPQYKTFIGEYGKNN